MLFQLRISIIKVQHLKVILIEEGIGGAGIPKTRLTLTQLFENKVFMYTFICIYNIYIEHIWRSTPDINCINNNKLINTFSVQHNNGINVAYSARIEELTICLYR